MVESQFELKIETSVSDFKIETVDAFAFEKLDLYSEQALFASDKSSNVNAHRFASF